ncbi:hypothetical protein AURDEDRAFT_68697 [Auricularia subglabra TFB-10046 SS5]|nr:hypothetical protein AURDEDRAFT_68697 [Auricularia subglabra TFB-10046 SS5]
MSKVDNLALHSLAEALPKGTAEDEEIEALRSHLQQAPDSQALLALSIALRRRFFSGSGRLYDLWEAITLLAAVPRPTLEDIGTAQHTFHPDVSESERNWVQWQPWLLEQGYMLPVRYHLGWVPSWSNSGDPTDKFISPDGVGTDSERVIDAVRLKDGKRVFLKVCGYYTDQELDIAAYFSSEPVRSDPRNHCYPLLDVLLPPLLDGERTLILVFPLLRRVFDPDPETIEELLLCISALAEGLAFMHEHNVAHRDVHFRNVMMDATHLMPEGWHPWMHDWIYPPGGKARALKILSRSRVPVKYYLIDFGLSVQFPTFEERRLVTGLGGLNRGLPEQSATVPYDAFAADIRMFGDMLRDWQTVCSCSRVSQIPD